MGRRRELLWSGPALADLRAAREFISRDDPGAARRLAARLRASVERLCAHPLSGRIVPEFGLERLREVIVPPYRIVYEVRVKAVVVLRIWHARRDIEVRAIREAPGLRRPRRPA